ncbi:hypothetical protein L249_5070, partial [Ophiocordyceps polyrhachis-furcata BCC 54312]
YLQTVWPVEAVTQLPKKGGLAEADTEISAGIGRSRRTRSA